MIVAVELFGVPAARLMITPARANAMAPTAAVRRRATRSLYLFLDACMGTGRVASVIGAVVVVGRGSRRSRRCRSLRLGGLSG